MDKVHMIKICTACPLHEHAKHNCLDGDGPIPCDLMVVGQGPGWEEDKVGRVFVGDSGRVLNKLLRDAGFSRKTTRATNSTRCFSGRQGSGDNKPKAAEIRACRPWLAKEVTRCEPKVIIACGDVAIESLLGGGSISSTRGQIHDLKPMSFFPDGRMDAVTDVQAKVITTYHPAYYLRERGWGHYPLGEADFALAGRILKDPATALIRPPEPIVLDKLDDLNFKDWVAYDLETTGLSPRRDRILTMSFCGPDLQPYVIDFRDKNVVEQAWILSQAERILNGCVRIAHNHKFDDRFLIYSMNLNMDYEKRLDDTMNMHQVLNENLPHALDELAYLYLHAIDYEAEFKATLSKVSDYGSGPKEKLYWYNGADTWATAKLYCLFKPQLLESGLWKLYKKSQLSMSCLLLDLEETGLPVDIAAMSELHEKSDVKMQELVAKARMLCGDKLFNPQSSKQIIEELFDRMGVEPSGQMTPGGKHSTSTKALEEILATQKLDDHQKEFVTVLLDIGGRPSQKQPGVKKLLGTFLKGMKGDGGFLKFVEGDGRIRPTFSQVAVTGRLTSARPGIHNTPHAVRSIIAPKDGRKIISADYEQLELRILAVLAREENMLRAFAEGLDIHAFTASQVFSIPMGKVDKVQRARGKTVNFGQVYGQQEQSLAEQLRIPEDEAQELQNKFFERFPRIAIFNDNCHQTARTKGFIESVFGRRRRLSAYALYRDTDNDKEFRLGGLDRQAANFCIQSAGADIFSYSMRQVHDRLRSLKLDAKLILPHHDALVSEASEKDVEAASKAIKEEMEKPVPELDGAVFPVEIKITDCWE